MSIRHGVYIQEEATAVQVPKTGNSSVQVVVGTAPVNMAENPSEAVNVPILANSGTEAMAALGYSVDFKNFTLCQTMFATSNLFQVSPVVYINVLDPAKHNKELAEAEYQVNQKQAVIEKEGIILEGLTVKNSTGDTELKAGEDYSAAFDSTTGFLTITMLAGGKGAAATAIKVSGKVIDPSKVTKEDVIGAVDPSTGLRQERRSLDRYTQDSASFRDSFSHQAGHRSRRSVLHLQPRQPRSMAYTAQWHFLTLIQPRQRNTQTPRA